MTNFKITGDTFVNNNTIFPPFEPITQSFTNCEFKLIEIRGGIMTLTFTDCKIKNNFRSLNASITGIINFIRCDFTGSSFNLLHSNKDAIVMTDCIGLPDDVALDTQNYLVKGITGYTTKLGAFLSHSYTANETPALTNELTSKSYVDSQVGTKQPTIEDGDLTIANTSGLQTALNDKQDTIEDGDLTIAKTSGLQTALDNKYDDTGGTISGSVTITSDLVVGTTNIITELDTKQDEITSTTDLTLNSITSDDLIVNNNLNVDNVITYEANQFNTIVIRRFDESTTLGFNLNELQLWVNNENILPSNASTLDAYFANWSEKDTPIQGDTIQSVVRNPNPFLFDEIISSGVEASGSGSINAVIVKDIPLTIVNDIQAIVLYHRGGSGNVSLAIGLTIELYNTQDDANLLSPLATTPVIERGVSRYRYDFPSIDTYSLGFTTPNTNGVYPNRTTQITADFEDLTRDFSTITEEATITNAKVNINTDTTIIGEVSCNTLSTTGNASVGGSLFLGDTNLTEDIDGLLTLDTNKRLIINRLTSASVITGENNCDYLNTTFQGKFGIPDRDRKSVV